MRVLNYTTQTSPPRLGYRSFKTVFPGGHPGGLGVLLKTTRLRTFPVRTFQIRFRVSLKIEVEGLLSLRPVKSAIFAVSVTPFGCVGASHRHEEGLETWL